MDLASTSIFIQCEAGTKTLSEVLASVVYNILKIFRLDLMREYDIFNLKLLAISVATQQKDTPGDPWVTVVTGRMEVQEDSTTFQLANNFNKLDIEAQLNKNLLREIVALDTPLVAYQPGLEPAFVSCPTGPTGPVAPSSLQVIQGNIVPLMEQNAPVLPIV
jgi:hypothetical protein